MLSSLTMGDIYKIQDNKATCVDGKNNMMTSMSRKNV